MTKQTLYGYNGDNYYNVTGTPSALLAVPIVPTAQTYYSVTMVQMRVGATVLSKFGINGMMAKDEYSSAPM